MIGKGKSVGHTKAALDYAAKKDQAVEIDRQYVSGESFGDIEREFKVVQSLNSRCQHHTLSFVISPSIEDGKRLDHQDWRQISQSFLEKMKLDEHQSVTFLHQDRDHKHLHIYVNRIGFDGKAYGDKFLGNRSAHVAEQIAQERGLKQAKDVVIENQQKRTPLKERVLEAHTNALKQAPANLAQYTHLMREHGVETHLKRDSKGKLVGVSYEIGKDKIKGSDVYYRLTSSKLEKNLADNVKQILKEREQQQKLAQQQNQKPSRGFRMGR